MHRRSIDLHRAARNYVSIFTYNGGTVSTNTQQGRLDTFSVQKKGKRPVIVLAFLVAGSACFVPGAAAASIMPTAGYNYKYFRRFMTTTLYSRMLGYINVINKYAPELRYAH